MVETCLFIIIGMIVGMGWAADRQMKHLEEYINQRISSLETEIIMNKNRK